MSPDDVDRIALLLHDLIQFYGPTIVLDDNYEYFQDAVTLLLDPFVTKDRNYN